MKKRQRHPKHSASLGPNWEGGHLYRPEHMTPIVEGHNLDDAQIEELRAMLNNLAINWAAGAQIDGRDESRPRKNTEWKEFIRSLVEPYEKFFRRKASASRIMNKQTGERTAGGPFVRFVQATLAVIGESDVQGEDIRYALLKSKTA